MEADIVLGNGPPVPGLGCLQHFFAQGDEVLDVRVGHPRHGELRSQRLDGRADHIGLEQFFGLNLAHPCATERCYLDDTQRCQPSQRLTHRRLARPKFLRDRSLYNSRVRWV